MSDGPSEQPGSDAVLPVEEPTGEAKVVILHIGAPWAGAPAVQAFLAANRQAVLASGLQCPRLDRGREGPRGAHAAGNGDELARRLGQTDADSLAEGLKLVDRVLAGRRSTRLLLSSEGFWRTDPARIGALARHLAPRVRLKVVAYVRPQVDQAYYACLERVTSGQDDRGARAFFDEDPSRFMAAARLTRLREQLGDASVVIRKYDPARWTDADMIGDFLDACGIQVRPEDRRRTARGPAPDVEHYLYARMAGSLSGLAEAANQLFRNPILAPLYGRARALRGAQIVDVHTARHIADACREDNRLLDRLAPAANLHLDEDNRRSVEAIEAEAEAPLEGVSRASLLLLGRVAALEARMAALKAAAEPPETPNG